jgi:NTE family protein
MSIGLALGSGSARGWAHIGVIRALAEAGIEPDIICGTSMGALVGAAHAAGNLDALETWARSVSHLDTARFLRLRSADKGLIGTERFDDFLQKYVAEESVLIERLDRPYAAVATALFSGRERWLTEGSLLDAVRASTALPGLLPPRRHGDDWLVDGGLVNPVPVSVCRALGADLVIAVNLNRDMAGKRFLERQAESRQDDDADDGDEDEGGLLARVGNFVSERFGSDGDEAPGLLDSMASAIHITQERITGARIGGDPPDVTLNPRLRDVGLLELYRARESIAEGRACVERMREEIDHVIDTRT